MRVGVLGVGAVGARTVRQLATITDPPEVVITDRNPAKVERLAAALAPTVVGVGSSEFGRFDIVVLCTAAPTPAWPSTC